MHSCKPRRWRWTAQRSPHFYRPYMASRRPHRDDENHVAAARQYDIMDPEAVMFGLGILTVSTSGAQGEREDTSGLAIREALEPHGYQVVRYEVVSDEKDAIAGRLAQWADAADVDLIVTTGGTGLGHRDVTPEACLSILDKEVPGLAEAMRAQTLQFTAMSMLSRSVAGIRGHTLIITLPGSTKGVRQCLDVVNPVLPHALELLRQETVNEHPN